MGVLDLESVVVLGLLVSALSTIATRTTVPFGWLREKCKWKLLRCPFCVSVYLSFTVEPHLDAFAIVAVAAISGYWIERYLDVIHSTGEK